MSLSRRLLKRLIRHLKLRLKSYRMKRGTCPFCERKNVPISSEHVIPGWVAETILAMMNTPHLVLARGNKVIHRSSGIISALNIEAPCACKDLKDPTKGCNEGWMHKLEDKVIPFMRPMIQSDHVTLLDTNRRALLTAWTIKTAMTHEFYGPNKARFFTSPERHALMTYLVPPLDRLHVWVGLSGFAPQAFSYPILLDRPFYQPVLPSLYFITFAFGHLILQLLAYRGAEWENGKLVRLDKAPFADRLLWLTAPDHTSRLLQWPPKPIGEDDRNRFIQRIFSQPVAEGFFADAPRTPPNRRRPR